MVVFRKLIVFLSVSALIAAQAEEVTIELKSLSAENQSFIQDVMKKVGGASLDDVCVVSSNDDWKKVLDSPAGAAVFFLTNGQRKRFICVDEDYFNLLGDEAKKFLIAHECEHLKQGHNEKRMCWPFSVHSLVPQGFQKMVRKHCKKYGNRFLLRQYRKCEKEADVAAARSVGAFGGVMFMRQMIFDHKRAALQSSEGYKRYEDQVYKGISHPSLIERERYLYDIWIEQERAVKSAASRPHAA